MESIFAFSPLLLSIAMILFCACIYRHEGKTIIYTAIPVSYVSITKILKDAFDVAQCLSLGLAVIFKDITWLLSSAA
jgi:hypothetical protein